jgi:hypothetical protein
MAMGLERANAYCPSSEKQWAQTESMFAEMPDAVAPGPTPGDEEATTPRLPPNLPIVSGHYRRPSSRV